MEFVYVVRRSDLFTTTTPNGFLPLFDPNHIKMINYKGFFVNRDHAEEDSSLKQIIPYCLVIKKSSSGELLLFRYQRLEGGGEERLHGKASIGVGGHINPVDSNQKGSLIDNCVLRELHEELIISEFQSSAPIGILNDDTNSVGSVHFGWVVAVMVKDAEVKEKETLKGEFIKTTDLVLDSSIYTYETWSELIAVKGGHYLLKLFTNVMMEEK